MSPIPIPIANCQPSSWQTFSLLAISYQLRLLFSPAFPNFPLPFPNPTLNTSHPIPFPLFANWSGFVFIVACRLTIDTLINDVADTRHSTPNANFVWQTVTCQSSCFLLATRLLEQLPGESLVLERRGDFPVSRSAP